MNISLGTNTLATDNNGYISQYNNSLASITIIYASGSISSVVRRISGSNTTISSHGFSKDTDQSIEVYANNGASTVNYSHSGNSYSLATQTWDLWVDGTRVVTGAATAGTLASETNISGFGFFAESSTGNAAWIYIDDLEYSNSLPFITAPTVTSAAATSVSLTGATFNGNVTSDGGSSITERGFVYKTTSDVAISDNKTAVSGTTGTYTLDLATLSVNTRYYFKSYAINAFGTTLSSDEQNFWTLANVPSAPTVNNPTTTTLDVSLSVNSNPPMTEFAIHETTVGLYVQANGSLGVTAVWQTASTWGTKTVTGLSQNTAYTFLAKARNGANIETTFGSTANETTLCATTEDFSNLPTASSGSYLSRSWTGTDNVTWTAEGARTDQTITGKAICFGNSGNRWVTSANYLNGIGSLSFNYVRAFTGTGSRTIQVYVNNVQVGGDISVNATSDDVINYSETINISGNVFLEIRSTGTAQVKIDDIHWTCYITCASPTTQASSINFSSTGADQMTLNWTNGNGGRRIVKMNTINSFTDPVDGQTYPADPVYSGSGEQVVYNGSGNSAIVTELLPSTEYWFQVFEYNCHGINTVYNISTSTNNPTSNITTGLTGIYRSKTDGLWTNNSTWETYNGSNWEDASSYPNHTDAIVTIRQHVITLNQSQKVVKNLTVESGGKLYRNHSSVTQLCYLNIKGDITCNGIIGNGTTPDAMGFNLLSGIHTITGNGAFHCFRIRNSNNAGGGNSTLTIDMDINLLWTQTIGGAGSGTNAIYNQRPNSTFNVIINPGKTLRLVNTTGDASIGIAGSGSSNLPTSGYYGGGFTVHGTITGNGFAWIGSASTSSNPKPYMTIKNGGLVRLRYLNYGSNNIASGGNFTIENGGRLILTDVGSGSDVWLNTTAGSIDYNIASGSTIEYSRSGDQNVPGDLFNYHHLIFSGSETKSFTSDAVINGDFSFGNDAYCKTNNYSLTIGRNWTNTNEVNFDEGTSTVIFNGSGLQTISCPGGEKFYSMTINDSLLAINNNVQVSNILTMTKGNLITGENRLELGSDTLNKGTLYYTSGYVIGNMRRWFYELNTGTETGLFPLGEANIYTVLNRHFNIQFTSAPSVWGYLDVSFNRDSMGYMGLPIGILAVDSCNAFNVTTTHHNGYWIANPDTNNNALKEGTYTLSLTGENFYSVQNLCQLTLLKRDLTGNWLLDGDHLQPTGTISMPTVSRSGLTGFSKFGFGGGQLNILPVELVSFDASLRQDDVLLEWVTASEINNDHFEIERSVSNNKNFRTIAHVPGNGNSNILTPYSTYDFNAPKGMLYYRLKQFDYNGQWEYSGITVVDNSSHNEGLQVVNPYAENNSISFDLLNISGNSVTVELYDISGKKIVSQSFSMQENAYNVSISVYLSSGVYFLNVRDSAVSITEKLFR